MSQIHTSMRVQSGPDNTFIRSSYGPASVERNYQFSFEHVPDRVSSAARHSKSRGTTPAKEINTGKGNAN